jgi:hypothetical protein
MVPIARRSSSSAYGYIQVHASVVDGPLTAHGRSRGSAGFGEELHRRAPELLEQGFEVAVVSDATAAAKVNLRFMVNDLVTTAEMVRSIQAVDGKAVASK